MIKIISKKYYDELINCETLYGKALKKDLQFYKTQRIKMENEFAEMSELINKILEENKILKKEKNTLKSKITRLENKIKEGEKE